jgi:hypothetical protein
MTYDGQSIVSHIMDTKTTSIRPTLGYVQMTGDGQ